MQHLQAHKKFKDISKKVDEIYSIYRLLKSDISQMSENQVKSQVRKILNRLPNVSDYVIDESLEPLKPFLIYGRLKYQSNEMKEKIKEVKSFIYSLDKDEPEISDKKIQEIKDRYTYIKKNEDTQDLDSLIKYAKITENLLLRLNFEQLSEEDSIELSNMKSELAGLIKNFEGIQKSRKYGPYLYEPIYRLASETYAKRNPEKAESITATILDFIEQPDKIGMFEPYIKRLISKRMRGPEFVRFYKSVMSMRSGEKTYESSSFIPYNEYLSVNETYESFTELQTVIKDLVEVLQSLSPIQVNKIFGFKELLESTMDSYPAELRTLLSFTGLIFFPELPNPGVFIPVENYGNFKGTDKNILKLRYPVGIIGISTNEVSETTILHELQHARDTFVSMGKMANTKMGQKYLKKVQDAYAKSEEIGEEIDPFDDPEVVRLYLRTPHEQSAFFIQAVHSIPFFDEDGNMLNIHEAYKLFKIIYNGYRLLEPKDKRRLGRKFAQYYYKIKEDNAKNV